MSGEYPYSISGYQFNADTSISLIHSGGHPIISSQHIQMAPPHLAQVHAPAQISHPQPAITPHQQMTRLKVEDALSYLDRVKQQFSSTPTVYNDFLDIMKKFKAQSIDTPGVINQVSSLFHGHPDLMYGFNAFLPTGYKIELNPDNSIRLFQPDQKGCILTGGSFDASHPRNSSRTLPDVIPDGSSSTPSGETSGGGGGGSQPVEFNHAINYVNKIKSRYQNKPDVYKTFLDILHAYQKEQKGNKEGQTMISGKTLSESEVYSRVSQLFKDQPDLLSEFSQFLPDAGCNSSFMAGLSETESPLLSLCSSTAVNRKSSLSSNKSSSSTALKAVNRRRLSSISSIAPVPTRRFKTDTNKDGGFSEAYKYYTLHDLANFDKIHKTLGDHMYNDFLKCIKLFTTSELKMSVPELMQMIYSCTQKMPELKKYLKDLLKQKDETSDIQPITSHNKERMASDLSSAIDYNSCKVIGQSYRSLPPGQAQPTCSGRTELCHEVLNDTYVSFPSWSEDSSSVIKKTVAEEQMFRCEEDKYQLDIIIENLASTITALDFILKKLESLQPDDITKRLIDNLFNLFSEALMRKNIHRLYGDRKTTVLEGMKKSPLVVIPVVLRRLEVKITEYRLAKLQNFRFSNEQNQKYYLKSLDHQGINFKQSDTKQLRSKALMQEIANAYHQAMKRSVGINTSAQMELFYSSDKFLDDATSLLIHHVKRQTSIHQDEKQKIKQLLKYFLPNLFFLPRGQLSDEEMLDDLEMDDDSKTQTANEKFDSDVKENENTENNSGRKSLTKNSTFLDDNGYSLLYGNQNWFIFIRLHQILCDRLYHFFCQSQNAIEENQLEKQMPEISVAMALGLRSPPIVDPENYYNYFLDMIKNYLDGNLETVMYEEQLREMFTIKAYTAYTMDKLVQSIVRQLQYLVTDPVCIQLMELFNSERAQHLTSDFTGHPHYRSTTELFYQRKAEQIMSGENYFKIIVYKTPNRVTIDQIVTEDKGCSEEGTDSWNNYIEKFIAVDEPVSDECSKHMKKYPVFAKRHLKWNKKSHMAKDGERGDAVRMNTESDESSMILDQTICRFKVNSFPMTYTTNTNSFLYNSTRRDTLTEQHQKERLLEAQLRRVKQFTSWLNKKSPMEVGCNWFKRQEKRETNKLFPHGNFCASCKN